MSGAIRFGAAEAVRLLEGAGLGPVVLAGSPAATFSTAVADSRAAGAGTLFVALPGERTDGHAFALQALASGAPCLLLDAAKASALEPALGAALRGALPPGAGASSAVGADGVATGDGVAHGDDGERAAILVRDPLAALQALATERRRRAGGLLRIGITGSSGKTTTKECLAAALGKTAKVAMNPGNLNSDIGLSLSMFGIPAEAEIGVFEMGMNRRGEIRELAAIYEPDYALVTNIGTAHIGLLGSRDAIAAEKKEIFGRFDGRQVGFVPESDDYRDFLRSGARGEMLDFGPRTTAGFAGARDLGLEGWELDWSGRRFRFPLVGRHNLSNCLGALAVAARLGADPGLVAEGLAEAKPLFGRSEILRGRVTLIRDCYNANPDSCEAALDFCDAATWAGRRLYVLGAMRELGEESESAHRAVGARAGRSRADALFVFGEEARPLYEAALEAGFAGPISFETDIDALRAGLKRVAREGDLVLLKASRGLALERAAEGLAD